MTQSNSESVALVKSIVQNLSDADHAAEWSAISIVVGIYDSDIVETYGYLYSAEGEFTAASVDTEAIVGEVFAYLETYFKAGDVLPIKILVQYDRNVGKYEITFEDTSESRWEIRPTNFQTVIEELRPRLG